MRKFGILDEIGDFGQHICSVAINAHSSAVCCIRLISRQSSQVTNHSVMPIAHMKLYQAKANASKCT